MRAATRDRVDDLKARAASADQERRKRLNKRLGAAFLEGAEECPLEWWDLSEAPDAG